MTPEQRRLIELENKWRNLFAEKPQDPEIQDPHLGLINVYSNFNAFAHQDETQDELAVPKLLTKFRQMNLKGSAVVSREQFTKNWQEFTQGCLDGLNWTNVFAAGGAVVNCLSSQTDPNNRGSDIDLFVVGLTNEQVANQKVKEIYNLIVKNTKGRGEVIRTNRAITILCSYPFRHVQIILRLYKSPAEVLLGFDIDSCCSGYDGTDVWCQERFKRALTKRYNLVNISRRSLTYEQRLLKYSKRGFAVAIPNLEIDRVSPLLYTKDPRNVQGLAKLLIYDHRQKNPSAVSTNFKKRKQPEMGSEEEGSDYNNDLHIPWGPEWQTDSILGMLNNKNRAKFFASVKRKQVLSQGGATAPQATGQQQKTAFNHMLTSNAQLLQQGDFMLWNRSLDNKQVQQPLEWIKDNPAYQDFDNGFRRLMTGSFEPIVDENWENGVYGAGPVSITSTTDTAKSTTTTTTSNFGGFGSLFTPSIAATTAPATQSKMFSLDDLHPQPTFASKNLDRKREREEKVKGKKTKEKAEKEEKEEVSSPEVTPVKPTKGAPKTTGYSGGNYSSLPSYIPPASASYYAAAGLGETSISLDAFPQPGSASLDFPQPGSIGLLSPPAASIATTTTTTTSTITTTTAAITAPVPSPAKPHPSVAGLGSGQFIGFSPLQPALAPSVHPAIHPPVPTPIPHPYMMPPPSALPAPVRLAAPAGPSTTTTKLLLLLALFSKQGSITQDEKGKLKDLVIQGSPLLNSALEVFEIDQDIPELVDTLRRICRFT